MLKPYTSSTLFGFEQVSTTEKARRVDDVFTHVSSVYDRMNDFMSLGMHHRWKQYACDTLDCYINDTVADIACGTGDISVLLHPRIPQGTLHCIDPNQAMLEQCKARVIQAYHHCIAAETLRLDTQFHRAIVSFGLRNFSDPEKGLLQIYKHLRPGGKLVIMEFNPPKSTHLPYAYQCYLDQILPQMGHYYADDLKSYQYLSDSIMTQPTPQERSECLHALGYQSIRYTSLACGIVGLFEAYR